MKGIVVGIVIAVPVGPVGVMCIRRTVFEGKLAGFVSGLGAATADAVSTLSPDRSHTATPRACNARTIAGASGRIGSEMAKAAASTCGVE